VREWGPERREAGAEAVSGLLPMDVPQTVDSTPPLTDSPSGVRTPSKDAGRATNRQPLLREDEWGGRSGRSMRYVIVGAALVATTGAIHLHLWASGYRTIPTIVSALPLPGNRRRSAGDRPGCMAASGHGGGGRRVHDRHHRRPPAQRLRRAVRLHRDTRRALRRSVSGCGERRGRILVAVGVELLLEAAARTRRNDHDRGTGVRDR